MSQLFTTALFVLSIFSVAAVQAEPFPSQTVHLGGSIWINPSETQSLPLSGPMYIKNLVIQAQGSSYAGSTIEVMVNGEVRARSKLQVAIPPSW